MGYPITGASATVNSITASTDVKYLFDVLKITEVTFNTEADDFDISELSGSGAATERLSGLMSGTIDFSGYYPKTAPKLGNGGLITYASGYVQVVNEWRLSVEFGEHDITALNATAPTAKRFMPSGLFEWSGSYTAHAVNSTAVSLPTAAASTGAAAAFILVNETDDTKLGGSINVRQLGHAIRKADKQILSYSFVGSGALTETVGTTYDPLRLDPGTAAGTATAWGAPSWDTNGDGVPDVSLVYYTFGTSRYYTVPVFLRSLNIEVSPGNPIRVSGQLRMADAITAT